MNRYQTRDKPAIGSATNGTPSKRRSPVNILQTGKIKSEPPLKKNKNQVVETCKVNITRSRENYYVNKQTKRVLRRHDQIATSPAKVSTSYRATLTSPKLERTAHTDSKPGCSSEIFRKTQKIDKTIKSYEDEVKKHMNPRFYISPHQTSYIYSHCLMMLIGLLETHKNGLFWLNAMNDEVDKFVRRCKCHSGHELEQRIHKWKDFKGYRKMEKAWNEQFEQDDTDDTLYTPENEDLLEDDTRASFDETPEEERSDTESNLYIDTDEGEGSIDITVTETNNLCSESSSMDANDYEMIIRNIKKNEVKQQRPGRTRLPNDARIDDISPPTLSKYRDGKIISEDNGRVDEPSVSSGRYPLDLGDVSN